jgi:hypothetical protein
MVGYGAESSHFVVELTYNYEVDKYELGNDFRDITISSKVAFSKSNVDSNDGKRKIVKSPDGYKFIIENEEAQVLCLTIATQCNGFKSVMSFQGDPVQSVSVGVSTLAESLKYWRDTLGMNQIELSDKRVVLQFGTDQAKLVLEEVEGGKKIEHGTAFGRIAFAVPAEVRLLFDTAFQDSCCM